MLSVFKNFVLVMLGSLVGAALTVGYIDRESPAAATAPATAPATTYTASQPATFESRPAGISEEAAVKIYERLSPAVVYVTNQRAASSAAGGRGFTERGVGSGVIIDEEGRVLTNNHVVDRADSLEVTLADGTRVLATLLGRDPANDLAVLQMEMSDAVRAGMGVASLGDSDTAKPGQTAIAIGNPFGFQSSMTSGIISSVGRTYSSDGSRQIRDMIQTDAAINPGNSGGPLINLAGEVIGINTAIESPVQGFVGVGLAVPVNTARRFLPEMLAGKTVAHPWLGLSGMTVTEEVAQSAGLTISVGVYVVHVLPGSPAEKATLRGAITPRSRGDSANGVPGGGDVVTAIDGQPLATSDDLVAYLDSRQVGDRITLSILRDGQPMEIQATLEEWPES